MLYLRKWQLAVVCLLALALIPFAPARRGTAQAPGYTVTDLGTLGGGAGEESRAYGLDECGRVVGESQAVAGAAAPFRPFYWDGTTLNDLGTLGGSSGVANALNQGGTVVGSALTAGSLMHPFVRPSAGPMQDIGTLTRGFSAEAHAINAAGQVVGVSEEGSNLHDRAFIWQSGVGMQPLSATWGTPIRAFGINDAGQVAGTANHNVSGTHAFVTIDGDAKDLGTLGGAVSVATEVNDSGEVSGYSYITIPPNTITQFFHAFRWKDLNGNNASDPGEMIDLGVLDPAHKNSYAYDINNAGQVVGVSETGTASNNISRAFIWQDANSNNASDPGELQDLNVVAPGTGWTFQEARDINNRGQIVGTGLNPDGKVHAFLLTPSISLTSVSGSGTFNGTATLTATLTTVGPHRAGQTIRFKLNGTDVGAATTDANGVATLNGVSLAGVNAGTYADAVSADFNTTGCTPLPGSSGTGTLTVAKVTPTITWGNPASIVYGMALGATQLNATANVAGGFAYTPAAGTVLHTGSGQVLHVDFTPTDTTNYNGASKDVSINVTKATLTITAADKSRAYGEANPAFTYTVTGFVNNDTSGVVTGQPSLSTTADATSAPGTYPITTAAGNLSAPDYTFAFVNGTLTVTKTNQSITFAALTSKTYGDADFTLSASASSGLAVSYSASGNCTVSGSTVHITGAGSCTITAKQAGDTNYKAAADVPQSFNISKAGSTTTVTASDATYDGQPHGATASVTGAGGLSQSLTVNYSGRNGTTHSSTTAPTNSGDYTASASFAGDDNHTGSSDSKNFQIARAGQTINFGLLPDRTFGDADFTISVTASSGLSVNFAASGQCTMNGSTIHLTGAGSCTVTASQAGNANYNAASDVSRTFQLAKAATTTAVSTSASPSGAGQSVTFTATVSSAAGTPTGSVQFKVDGANSGPPVALGAGGTAKLQTSSLAAGAHTVTADYSGDSNFNASAGALASGQVVGSIFDFSAALYTVTERGNFINISVRRTGDTAAVALVDYTTDDAAAPSVTCASVTGLALDHCDFTRSVGTLNFGAGDTEKTFIVLVNDDTYTEGPETLSLRLSNPSAGAALGTQPAATLQITDDTPELTGNPIDGSTFFVRQHYHDFLNREPDASGLAFWTQEIEQCGADAGCREVKRINVSAAFFLSIEFQETGYLVYRTYKAAFGDATSPNVAGTVPVIRLNEFLPDTRRIGEGVVVNVGNWQAQLEANKNAYMLEFVQRQRFLDAYPQTLSPPQFVDKLNANAGGALDATERQNLINELTANNTSAGRASVLRKVAEDANLAQAEFTRAFVLMQFYGYLRRNPDDPQDTDFRGWKFWLDKLNAANGNFVQAEMVKAFLDSIEYRTRFAP